jgi:hypothetical protein
MVRRDMVKRGQCLDCWPNTLYQVTHYHVTPSHVTQYHVTLF